MREQLWGDWGDPVSVGGLEPQEGIWQLLLGPATPPAIPSITHGNISFPVLPSSWNLWPLHTSGLSCVLLRQDICAVSRLSCSWDVTSSLEGFFGCYLQPDVS